MTQLYANNASTHLASGINSSTTTIAVTSGTGSLFPSISGGNFFLATLAEGSNIEIVKVTARTNDIMTVVRGQESTIPNSFTTAAVFEMRVTAATLNNFLQASGVLGVVNGGTGQTTSTAAFNALAPSQAGNSGFFLTTNGTNTSWAQPSFSQITGTVSSSQLPNPGPSSLGGIESYTSPVHQWINVISTLGVPSSTQPAFTDISGTVASSQLPNPGPSSLGGIESYTAVTHQWINAISTLGVPSSTQPSFTDISGTVASGQLPNPGPSSLGGVQSFAAVTHQFLTQISTLGVVSAAQPATSDLSDFPAQTGNSGKFLTTNGSVLSWGAAVTGSGTATQVAFFSGTTALSSDSNLFWDNTNKRLGVGTASPTVTFQVNGSSLFSNNATFNGLIIGNTVQANTTSSLTVEGTITDGATAVAVIVDNTVSLANASAKIESYRSGGSEKSFIDKDGLLNTSTPHTISAKRSGMYTINTTADTSFNVDRLQAPSISGTITAAPAADATMMMLQFQTGNVSGNTSGLSGPYNSTRFDYRPKIGFVVRTDSAITNQRIYIGLTDADLSGAATLAATNTNHYVAFRYDTGLGDTNWMAVSSDGTTASATSTGVAVAANTTYTLSIGFFTSGTALFRINNASNPQVSKTTNLPTGTTNVGIEASLTTLSATAQNLYIAKIALEQN